MTVTVENNGSLDVAVTNPPLERGKWTTPLPPVIKGGGGTATGFAEGVLGPDDVSI